ncbi:MAG: ABC transporter permease [Thermomicrobiales bacterium]|jgi:peptide/nickel transport system permease protein|nr:ABC transporter permease [Thermomicrobiales bacterium]
MQQSIPASPTLTAPEPGQPAETRTRSRSSLLRQIAGTPSGAIGLAIVTLYVLVALAGALGLTPFDPLEQHRPDRLQGPNRTYLMGTDMLGRDVLSRIIKGGTNSMIVVLASVTIATAIGTTIGVFSAWAGGFLDNVAMRVMDIFFAFPAILLALLVVTVLGTGIRNTILAIAIVYTPIFARVARGPVLSLKETDFVEAASAIGSPSWRILLRHVLPNTVAPTIVQISLALSWALLTEAGLSFLGLGTPPPEPSWGQMLSDSTGIAEIAPWLLLFPGLAIMISVLGFNLLGDSLRDALDPRLRR